MPPDTTPDTITPELFEQYVRDCLAHLYDYSFLRGHPLLGLLVPEQSGASQVQAFRQLMTETIERLRPKLGATFQGKGARVYNILFLRYIDQQPPQEVMQQLALSERQFYRDHPKAITTISQMLWEGMTGEVSSTGTESERDESPLHADSSADIPVGISVESELQRVQNTPSTVDRTHSNITALLQGALGATQSLAQRHNTRISLAQSHELLVPGIQSQVLRQAVLLMLSQLIIAIPDGELHVTGEIVERVCGISFSVPGQHAESTVHAVMQGIAQNGSLQTLIESLEGRIKHYAADDALHIVLEVPLNHKTVLVVDDNPGMLDLFNRYLAGQPYHIVQAHEGEEAVQLARQTRSDVIILDVMLPGKDGWEVLQSLKNHPLTRETPVLICSVLDASELALSLGADAYLKKPPSQAEFLKVISRMTSQG
jgi:CheY-like chemotaxis protein